jgi:hypothetical protein
MGDLEIENQNPKNCQNRRLKLQLSIKRIIVVIKVFRTGPVIEPVSLPV